MGSIYHQHDQQFPSGLEFAFKNPAAYLLTHIMRRIPMRHYYAPISRARVFFSPKLTGPKLDLARARNAQGTCRRLLPEVPRVCQKGLLASDLTSGF